MIKGRSFSLIARTLFVVLFSFVVFPSALAITLDKSSYYVGDPVIALYGGSGPLFIFKLSDESIVGSVPNYAPDWDVNYSGLSEGDYSVLEFDEFVHPDCISYALLYNECKASDGFISEALFTILPVPSGGGGYSEPVPDELLPEARGGIASYYPKMTILMPQGGGLFSRIGIIDYKATDKNDNGEYDERFKFGLGKNPVSLSYTDKIAEWDRSFVAPGDKVLIADKLPTSGPYSWDVKDSDLSLGVLYRIVADVVDATGLTGQDVSGFFMADYILPQFIVSTDPPVTRGDAVTISVDSSEVLKSPPTVTVTQEGGTTVAVAMKGNGLHYEGVYTPIRGYDGAAFIFVSGTDTAGNEGSLIVSGGQFLIGVNPPPKPNITSPRSGTVVATSTISVTGTARSDSTVVLKVNGIDTYEVKPNKDGVFTIPNVLLYALNRGAAVLSFVARDQGGLISAAVPITVKYNIPPVVTLSKPERDATLSGVAPLEAVARDANNDPLTFTYQIISAQDFNALSVAAQNASSTDSLWTTIGDAVPSTRFNWDSTEVENGLYYLRIRADDGSVNVSTNSVPVSIHNVLPFLRFEDGRRTLSNKTPVTVVGRALLPNDLSASAAIVKVEYSIDNGKKWTSTPLVNDAIGARFSVTFSTIAKEGTYPVLWRVTDSRKLVGRTSHVIGIDKTPPAAPIIYSLKAGSRVGDDSDTNPDKKGLQITVSGTAEPQSTVTLASSGATQTVMATFDGSFVFRDVEVANRGLHALHLTTTDQTGNMSVPTTLSFIYDNPPVISFLSPQPSSGFTSMAEIKWNITSKDNVPVQGVTLSWRRGNGAFTNLPVTKTATSYVWDVAHLAEALDYELRLSAGDGLATTSETVGFAIDRKPPTLSSLTVSKKVLGKSDMLRGVGSAADSLSGVAYVEYAIRPIDEESSESDWSLARITSGYLQKNASYVIAHPVELTDGAYRVQVRVVDAAGNVSPARPEDIIVDTTSPHIGSFQVVKDGMSIIPDNEGVITVYQDSTFTFGISLETDTASASITIDGRTAPLAQDIASGLWEGTLTAPAAGEASMYISVKDMARNEKTNVRFGSLASITRGGVVTTQEDGTKTPLQGALIRVLKLNEQSGTYVPFSSSQVLQSADLVVDDNGEYELALPQGTFKLLAHKSGYATVRQDVTLERPAFVGVSFTTEKRQGFFGFIQGIINYFHFGI